MNTTNKIDFLLSLDPHGWSTCWIMVDGKVVELNISHAFYKDPYVDLIEALSGLMRGESVTTFCWYGEPGGEHIVIERNVKQERLLKVRIDSFQESFGEEITDFQPMIHFEIKERQLLLQFYFQLKKIDELLQDTSFAEGRKDNFPTEHFKSFEWEIKQYLKLQ